MSFTRSILISWAPNDVTVPLLANSHPSLTVSNSGTESITVIDASTGLLRFTPSLTSWGGGRTITAVQDVQWADNGGTAVVGDHPITTTQVEQIEANRLQIQAFHADDLTKAQQLIDLEDNKVDKVAGKVLSSIDFTSAMSDTLDSVDDKVDKVAGKGLSTVDFTSSMSATLDTVHDKVDKESGKGLSTIDFTSSMSATLDSVDDKVDKEAGKGLSTIDFTPAMSDKLDTVDDKVDKVAGKVLSSIDFTSAMATKLDSVDDKVDKVAGKGLSTVDFTSAMSTKLDGVEAGAEVNTINSVAGKSGDVLLTKSDVDLSNVDDTSDLDKPISTAQQNAIDDKVDKETGKGLSTNDFTQVKSDKLDTIDDKVDKETGKGLSSVDFTQIKSDKLEAIEDGAEVNTITSVAGKSGDVVLTKSDVNLTNVDDTSDLDKPVSVAQQSAIDDKVDKVAGKVLSTNDFSTALRDKLLSLPTDAEKNVIADWSETSATSDAYIHNKPDLSGFADDKGAENVSGGYAVVLGTGLLPASIIPPSTDTGPDMTQYSKTSESDQRYAAAGLVNEHTTKLSDLGARYSDADVDLMLESKVKTSTLTKYATHAELQDVFNHITDIPQAKVIGLQDRLQLIETGHPTTEFYDSVMTIIDAHPSIKDTAADGHINQALKPRPGWNEKQRRSAGQWKRIDDNLRLRISEDDEDIQIEYQDTNDYPSEVFVHFSFRVTADGEEQNRCGDHGPMSDGDNLTDWWGGWFLDHAEFEGNETFEAKILMNDNRDEKPSEKDKIYRIKGTRTAGEDLEWEFSTTISGYNISTNPDFDENYYYHA